MDPIRLPSAAENIRKEIKRKIPETSTSSNQVAGIMAEIRDDGNKTYLGNWLAERISLLKKEMHISDVIGDVCTSGSFWCWLLN